MVLNMNRLSVIVCAYTEKRWEDLLSAVSSLRAQIRPADEIILAIDHNPALYEQVKAQFPEIVVVENSQKRGLSGARNSGIAAAHGDMIAFMDEDAVADPNWLSLLEQGFSEPGVLGVGGAIVPLWISGRPAWFPDEFNWVVGCTYRGMPEVTSAVRNLIGCNMAFRTTVFQKAGDFRSEIGRVGTFPAGCEETELCIRARQFEPEGHFLYEPLAQVHHRVPAVRVTFKYFTSRCYAEGLSKALVSQLVGAQHGLSNERTYTFKTLPRGFFRGFADALFRRQGSGLGRAGAISLGLAITTVGYIAGRLMLMRNKNKLIATPNLSLDQA
jgi:glycosyltransferase involved in cell wall biosynthesis